MSDQHISRRRFLHRTAATLAAGAFLTACGTPAATPGTASESTSTGETPNTQPAGGEQATITFWWQHGGSIGKAVEAANAEFQKRNTNIKIDPLQVADLGTKVSTALAGGTGPDIWDTDAATLNYAVRGALLPLDQYLQGSPVKVDDYIQKPSMVWKGKVYAIPALENGMENALLWNKQIFRDAGLDPEKPPTSFTELVDVAVQLTKFDDAGNITQLGFNPRDSSGGMFPNWLTINGFTIYDAETQKITLTQPQAIQFVEQLVAFEKQLDAAKIGAFHKTYPAWGSVTPGGAFSTGKEAMMIDGSWAPGGLATLAPDIEVGYTWGPSLDGSVKSQQMGAHQLGINTQSKVQETGWKLIEFLATEGNDLIYKASGSFSHSKPFAASVDTSPWKGLQWYFDSVDQATFVMPRAYCPNVGDVWGKWWASVDDLVFERESSAQMVLARAEQESQELLDKMMQS